MLSLSTAASYIKDKRDFFNSCERNGYHLLDFNSAIITRSFLHDVRHGIVDCPRYSDLKLSPCPEPPTMLEATADLLNFLELNYVDMSQANLPKFQCLVAHLEKRSPSRPWVLVVLSTLTAGGHTYFEKNFRPAKRKHAAEVEQIENADGFFTNFPTSKLGKNSRQSTQRALALIESKETRAEKKVHQLNETVGSVSCSSIEAGQITQKPGS